MSLRRAEDSAALTLLGAQGLYLEFLDAVYRADVHGDWLYDSEESLWADVHSSDPMVTAEGGSVASALAAHLPAVERQLLYVPLALGNHIDHQIVHAAGRQFQNRGYQVAYYEDYPYAEQPGELDRVINKEGAGTWQCETVTLMPSDVESKTKAIAYYHSQMHILFGGAEEMPNRIWSFAASQAEEKGLAERIWWNES
jgi:hypothetical protein